MSKHVKFTNTQSIVLSVPYDSLNIDPCRAAGNLFPVRVIPLRP
nr:hypothetical protein [uncultured Rhodopila sp.]